MRITITVPSELFQELLPFVGDLSFSQFVSEGLRAHVQQLKSQTLAQKMEEGYLAESQTPSLEPQWSEFETQGWV